MFTFKFKDADRFIYPGQELRPRRRRTKASDMMIDGTVRQAVETGRTRMMVAASLFAIAYLVIAGRLFDLMVLKSADATVPVSQSASMPLETGRADIVDRNGMVLATNLPTVNVYADSKKILDADEATRKLLHVLPTLDATDVREKLTSGRRFIYLDRNLTPRQQAAINAEGIPGIYFEKSERRVYPHGPIVSHVLGATDPDNGGIAGVERNFDKRLRENPAPLKLSIDLRVQAAVRANLLEAMAKFSAKGAAGLVMDARDGEILAMVSLPDYDPATYGEAPADAQFNRATLGVYEMGSTFKLFNTAMALDSGMIQVTDSFDTSKPLRIARFTIHDDHVYHRPQNVAEILVHSSNIGSARMAIEMGKERQRAFLTKLGLLNAPDLEIPEIGSPLYPSVWRDSSLMTISFGHGIAVTAVNLADGVAALVNGGTLYKPTLLAVNGPETEKGPVATDDYPRRVISENTSLAMRQLMRLVVTDGTAKKADIPGYLIGGKTGTAEKVAATGGYAAHKLRTTFAGAFPMDNPRYVLVTILDEPQGLKSTFGWATSGWNATPTSGTIIADIAPLLGVFPRLNAMEPLAPLTLPAPTNGPTGLGQNAAWLVGDEHASR